MGNQSTMGGRVDSWRDAALWFVLGVAGQAAALSVVWAGKTVHFQHARPMDHPAAVGFVVLEAVVVAVGLWRWRLRWPWDGYRLWVILAVLAGTAAAASRSPGEWVSETAFTLTAQAAALGSFALATRAAPDSLVRGLRLALEGGGPRLPMGAAIFTVVVAATLSVGVYERQPHLQDEMAYLHQSRIFAAGMVAMPPPPVPQAFEYYLLDVGKNRTASAMPPGFALLLAPAVRLSLEWMVNPLLGGLNVWLLYLVLRRVYGPPVPLLGALLLAASPWHCFLAMSFMNHVSTLTAMLLAVLGVLRGGVLAAVAAGLASGWLIINRPLDGVTFMGLCLAWMLIARRSWWAFAASSGAVAALVLPYNYAITGSATTMPLTAYMDRVFGAGANALGFGANRGFPWPLDPFPGHGLADAVVNAQLNASTLNTELFGWAAGSLIFLAMLAVMRKWSGADRCLALVAAATVAVYSLYWFSGGPDFGPRYWFMLLAPCVALTARGIAALRECYGERVLLLAALLTLSAWVTFVPWRAADKYAGYLGMTPALRRLAEREGFGHGVVVVRGPEFPDFASVAWMNPLDWGGDGPLYARDAGPESVAKLRQAYPNRPMWVVEGPSVTGLGYRIVDRPRR